MTVSRQIATLLFVSRLPQIPKTLPRTAVEIGSLPSDPNDLQRAPDPGMIPRVPTKQSLVSAKCPVAELLWLVDLQWAPQPVDLVHPVWVRTRHIINGPTLPPEMHPNCEFCLITGGEGWTLAGREKIQTRTGDLLIYASGVPHWFRITRHPFHFIAFHFLPSTLFELAPEAEASKILRRFTVQQPLERRLVRLPKPLQHLFDIQCKQLSAEFEQRRFGWEAKLRSGLVKLLIELLRWEDRRESLLETANIDKDWSSLTRAFQYLRAHVAEPIYSKQLAAAVGVSEPRLKVLFREVLGVPWSSYLACYRIDLAAKYLRQAGPQRLKLLDLAQSVGFENQSHFNFTFRSIVGLSPRQYAAQHGRPMAELFPNN